MNHPLRKLRMWLGGAFCFTFATLYAVGPEKDRDFKTTVHYQNAALTENAAFLTSFQINRISYIEASLSKLNGNFLNYNGSDNSLEYRLKTESYYRLHERLMLYGALSYASFTGQEMAGSAFINPYYMPFDIVEMDDANKGRKRLETYRLRGALGLQLTSRLALGADLDYVAGNYAKHKDLRHQNTRMDMRFAAGVNYQLNSRLTAGLSYSYRRNSEDVSFDVYGNTDRQYYSLISYGAFYGRREAFGETGFTSARKPLFTQTHGGALQLQLHPLSGWKLFNELYYKSLKGRFGTDVSNSVTYTRHEGSELGYKGRFTLGEAATMLHIIDFSAGIGELTNFENSYKESTDEKNVSQIIYYGSNEVLDRSEWKGSLAYTAYLKEIEGSPMWIAGLKADFYKRKTKTVIYPYYRRQDFYQIGAEGYAERNIRQKLNLYTIRLSAGYGSGGGTAKEDGLYATPGSGQAAPASRDDLLMQEYEYFTASRVSAGIALKYERKLKWGMSGYVGLNYWYTQAYSTEVTGDHAGRLLVRAGCRF